MDKGTIHLSTANAVGAVLNKKMGVTTGFAPSVWADTINLMGKLPEKTVNGSIAHFEDGADGVPMKNLVCGIDATLDGVSSVEVIQTGKNLISSAQLEQGSISAQTGGDLVSSTRVRTTYIKVNPNTTYTFTIGGSISLYEVYQYDINQEKITYSTMNAQTYTLTTRETCKSIRFIMRYADNTKIVPSDVENLQIEQSATATSYEPCVTTTHTVDLGQTIYGGHVDVVTGAGNNTHVHYTFNGSENWQFPASGYNYIALWGNEPSISNSDTTQISNYLECDPTHNTTYGKFRCQINGAIVVGNLVGGSSGTPKYTDIAEFKAYLSEHPLEFCYEIEAKTDFTVTPITPTPETTLGVNNIWCNTGSTSVTYRRDIDLALSGSTPLMMMSRPPVIEEENIIEDEPQMEGDEE